MKMGIDKNEALNFMIRLDPCGIVQHRVCFRECYPSVYMAKDNLGRKYFRDFNDGFDLFIVDSREYEHKLNTDRTFFGKVLGIQLGWFIRSKGFTQTEAANHIGVSQPTLSRYISGSAMPDTKTVWDICTACGFGLCDIFDFVYI